MASLEEIRQLFFVECEEQLEQITDGLGEIESLAPGEAPDPETINTMFRAAHSIKGGAASFSLDAITRYAHCFESVLDELRSGQIALSDDLVRAFYGASDFLAELVALGAAGTAPDESALETQLSLIAAQSAGPAAAPTDGDDTPATGEDLFAAFTPLAMDFAFEPPAPEPSGFVIFFRPTAALYANGHEPVHLFRELETLGALTVDACLDEKTAWKDPAPGIAWTLTLETECGEDVVREIFEFAEPFAEFRIAPLADEPAPETAPEDAPEPEDSDEDSPEAAACEAAAEEAAPDVETPDVETPDVEVPDVEAPARDATEAEPQVKAKSMVRVDLELVDDLMNMVGELVITQSIMSQSIAEAEFAAGPRIVSALDEFRILTRQIQERTMAIRAQSVKPLFQRMGRIARETAQIAGKDIRFATEGEETEVDRTVIERLVDPLTHIIRNAIDHGVEAPDRREAAGKERAGTVTLSAAHRSGRVLIEVRDNGGGVDRDRVLASAIQKGLVQPGTALDPAEIDRLLFAPGFSTASEVTSLSGRGVGMDVVNKEIQKLGGRVAIISTPGRGTTISISLPLTLAVLDGMIVDVAGHTMVVPISAIAETIRPEPADLRQVGPSARTLNVRDTMVPVIDLATVFGIERPAPLCSGGVILLVEDDKRESHGLLIDRILDQRQVVIKSLEDNYGHVAFVAAATILGNGRIALIADVEEIIHNETPAVPVPARAPIGVPA